MWQLDGTIASWECEHLTAQLDLLSPNVGVHVQRWHGQLIDPEPVLQLSLRTPIHASSLDAYIRVGDLIVQYPECADTGYRLQLRWSVRVQQRRGCAGGAGGSERGRQDAEPSDGGRSAAQLCQLL